MRITSMPLSNGTSQSSSMTSGSPLRIASSAAMPSAASVTERAPRLVNIDRVSRRIGVAIDDQDIEAVEQIVRQILTHDTLRPLR